MRRRTRRSVSKQDASLLDERPEWERRAALLSSRLLELRCRVLAMRSRDLLSSARNLNRLRWAANT